jgi:hypothetical protein
MPRPRTLARISNSLHRQLNSYGLAASAAGVGLLALSQHAEAKIVYTKTHHVVGKNSIVMLDLNHDGTTDFTIKNRNCPYGGTSCTSDSWNLLTVQGAPPDAVQGTKHTSAFWAADLKAGARIADRGTFARSAMLVYQCQGVSCAVTSRTHTSGDWPNVRNRYLGLKFQIHGKAHYGWARLSVKTSNNPLQTIGTLTGYAYETIANKGIIAGKTKGPNVIAGEDATLSHLAAGSRTAK